MPLRATFAWTDPGPLDHPCRCAPVPHPPLQLAPIDFRDLHHPHVRGHEKWSPGPEITLRSTATEH